MKYCHQFAMTYKEIAQELGMTVPMVKKTIHEAMSKIRTDVREHPELLEAYRELIKERRHIRDAEDRTIPYCLRTPQIVTDITDE